MEFKVYFTREDKNGFYIGSLVNFDSEPIGLEGVDKIREFLGLNLDLERIEGRTKSFNIGTLRVHLTEKIARKSGLFRKENEVKVRIIGKFDRFCKKTVKFTKDKRTGEVYSAWFEWTLDENALLEAWQKAGFPTEWEVS